MSINIPSDTLFEILLHTDPQTLIASCQTNKSIANICNDEHFWVNKILVDFEKIAHRWRSDKIKKIVHNGDVLISNKPTSINFKRFYFDLINDHIRPILITNRTKELELPPFLLIRDANSINSIIKTLNIQEYSENISLTLIDIDHQIRADVVVRMNSTIELNEMSDQYGNYWDMLTEIVIANQTFAQLDLGYIRRLLSGQRIRLKYV